MRNNLISKKIKYFYTTGKKSVALLIDPEKVTDESSFRNLVSLAMESDVGFFFIGGSLITTGNLYRCISLIKALTNQIPVVLFPGNAIQVAENADGILFLSLISGRNPDLLIGQHVVSAPFLAKSTLEVLPTGYMLFDSGGITSVNYISQTLPLPNNKPNLAIATALAGTFLGLQYLFLDAGSGAKNPVSSEIISSVKENTACPLFVGGGIDTPKKAKLAWESGADIVVLGNGVEENPGLLIEVLDFAHVYNLSLNVN
ncbi:MAG: geranylgeranylglyceryl/heptaprenylglyceryl phosphate synthase [Anditalea sp.]